MEETRQRKLGKISVFLLVCVTWIVIPANATRCEDLVKLNLSDVSITLATQIKAGTFIPPNSSNALETADFCRVVAVAKPTSDSVINFEVWIPSAKHWNHDFEGVGNGGYTGAIRTRPICPYPKVARWNGTGSSDDAKNFACEEISSTLPNLSTKSEQ